MSTPNARYSFPISEPKSQRRHQASAQDPYTPLPSRLIREQDGWRSRRASDSMAVPPISPEILRLRNDEEKSRLRSLLMPAESPSEKRTSLDIGAWMRDVSDAQSSQSQQRQQSASGFIESDARSAQRDSDATLVYPPRTYTSPVPPNRASFAPNASPRLPQQVRALAQSQPSPPFQPRAYAESVSEIPSHIYVKPPHPVHGHQPIPPPSALPNNGESHILPTFRQPPPNPSADEEVVKGVHRKLLQKIKAFWKHITTEPPIPSPPPSESSSRRSSFDGGQRPDSLTKDNMEKHHTYDQDMFIRAMKLNKKGDGDGSGIEAVDADVQPFGDPNPSHEIEVPKALQRVVGANKDDKIKKPSYKERRKKPKHMIIYHRDSKEAQQRFIITLSRALLLFGSPSHRVEPQLVSVTELFELPAQFVHSPGCIQVSFGRPEKRGSETVLIKSDTGLDLGRIHATHAAYRAVVRDEISATEGRERLEELLTRPPLYSRKTNLLLTVTQSFILCGSSFGGSFLDMLISAFFSIFVYFAQEYVNGSHLSSSGSDIFLSGIVSLASRALEVRVPHQLFCYQAISSTAVASLLPGAIMLAGVLDIASKNIYLGSCKLVTGIMTSLYLGFGLTLGSDIWLHFDAVGRRIVDEASGKAEYFYGTFISTNATTPMRLAPPNLTGVWVLQENAATTGPGTIRVISGCMRDPHGPWYVRPLPWWTLFFLLPVLNIVLSMRRAQPVWSTQLPVMVLISCASVAVTTAANTRFGLSGHPDYTAFMGSFVVSLLGNVYARRFGGTAFTFMLTGILLLIPTGLAQAGGLASSDTMPGDDEYTQALDLARKMLSVIIGVMSGVYLSARLVYAFGEKKNSAFVTF